MKTSKGQRLRPNQGLLGPEYYGCCNTGQRPKLMRCAYSDRYIVATENDFDTLRMTIINAVRQGDNGYKFRKHGATAWAYKSRSAAGRKFEEMCDKVRDFNDRTRAAAQRDRAAAQRGDLGAALRLADY